MPRPDFNGYYLDGRRLSPTDARDHYYGADPCDSCECGTFDADEHPCLGCEHNPRNGGGEDLWSPEED